MASRLLLLGLAVTPGRAGDVDAREVIRRAVEADQRNWDAARKYGFWQRVDLKRFDSAGGLKSREVKCYDVTLPDGSPYWRLAGRDDRPLPPTDDRKEREKLARSIAERRAESAAQRARRQAVYEKSPQWRRDAWQELPFAFDFRLIGTDQREGRSLYVIEAVPRPGYQPRSSTAKVMSHLRGRLWVDAREYQFVKAEAEVLEDTWVGLFLARVQKGSRVTVEQTGGKDGVWMPAYLRAAFYASLGLLIPIRAEYEASYLEGCDLKRGAPILSLRREE
jgi:hypothetical protein